MLRTYCPECQFPQTIAPAALGQPVQCRGCLHTYTAEVPDPAIIDNGRPSSPPALPKRRQAVRSPFTTRHGKTLVGLLSSSVFTLVLISGGIVYLVSTATPRQSTTPVTAPTYNNYTPPPVYDGPKKIDDLIKEAPRKDNNPPAPMPFK